ncbi:probable histone-lysine N-methyltransferase CG1716 [Contarinia nasturtii]|uniref:probable histone-lysine N-methyltransferase CG1716 n=1 Tax=Contarinia nasturtii TaxID=265458 RepID=UPI0012D3917F|nr:probable histone-lysine N-methyltransferase CG1716 [Contarinia nasturtii]
MSAKSVEHLLQSGFEQLKIDDSNVNKMNRRRSVRIQIQYNRSLPDLSLLNLGLDLENNNLLPKKSNIEAESKENEIKLELENIHYKRALEQFTYITKNEYLIRRKKTNNDDDSPCGCTLTRGQIVSSEFGCGNKCLNRAINIECDDRCKFGHLCSNQRIRKQENAPVTIFITEKKGYGLFASTDIIGKDTFIMEFVGEVVSMAEFTKRSKSYSKQKIRHHYVMTASGKNLFDATQKGNLTRFINHSCDPNAETQKWTVDGECRIGIYTKRTIKAFEEITMNYQFERFGKDAQECFCESPNCTGWIGS